MRKLSIIIVLSALLLAGCSSVECPMNSHVYATYAFYIKGDTAVTIQDAITVSTTRFDGNDTVLLNRQRNAHKIQLPMSYNADVDTLLITLTNDDDRTVSDYIYVEKSNLPHMESLECGTTFFHQLLSVSSTHNFIDSVAIKNKSVNYDNSIEHIHIYPKQ